MVEASFQDAQEQILASIEPLENIEDILLQEALNRVIAQDIFATGPYPPFDNSAVDGFAVSCEEDAREGATLRVSGILTPGSDPTEGATLRQGLALRVLTGTPVPPNTYAVVMQENVVINRDCIQLTAPASRGKHIRRKGDDFSEGYQLVSRGFYLSPGAIALLASQGIQTVKVFRKPRIAVLTTGSELVSPEEETPVGKVRDSNSPMLASLLKNTKPEVLTSEITRCPDSIGMLEKVLEEMTLANDVVLVSGGASVGDHDYTRTLVSRMGHITLHGVKMKPGKPFLFGKIGNCFVFGLPGNPASVFVCFHLYVKPAIRKLSGLSKYAPRWFWVRLLDSFQTQGRDEFVRAKLLPGLNNPDLPSATVIAEQGSFGLRSLAFGDCLVLVPAHTTHNPGEPRLALLLDH
ncbi:MAG: molybdopterin molybdotransferase MoeA [Candidatus Caldarchaeum sp.]